MPLIAKIGRRSWRVRLFSAVLYGLLIGGGLTMVHPFLLMISNSVTSNADWKDFRLIPKYFFDAREQFRKIIVEAEHEEEFPYLFGHNEWFGGEDVRLKDLDALFKRDTNHLARMTADWREFMKGIPHRYWRPYFNWQTTHKFFTPFVNCVDYRKFLARKYSNDIVRLNREHGTYYKKFGDIWHLRDGYWRRLWAVPDTPQWHDWVEWKGTIDPLLVYPYPMEMEWWKYIRYLYVSIDRFNEKQGTNLAGLIDVHLDDAIHHGLVPLKHVENFVFEKCNSMYYMLNTKTSTWNAFLTRSHEQLSDAEKKLPLAEYLKRYPPARRCPTNTAHYALWTRYINEKKLDAAGMPVYKRKFGEVEVWSPVREYRAFLKARYSNDIDRLNAAYGPTYVMGRPIKSFDEIRMLPVPDLLYHHFAKERKGIMRKFVFGNYKTVLDFVALHGRALWNTLIFIILCIGSALIVNPMAAYALLRYRVT